MYNNLLSDFTIINNELFFVSGTDINGIGKFKIEDKDSLEIKTVSEFLDRPTLNIYRLSDSIFVFHKFYTFSSTNSFDSIAIKNDLTNNFKVDYGNLFFQTKDKFSLFSSSNSENKINQEQFCHFLNYNKEKKEIILGYYQEKVNDSKYIFLDNIGNGGDFSSFKTTNCPIQSVKMNSNLFRDKENYLYFITYDKSQNNEVSTIGILDNDYKLKSIKQILGKNYYYINNSINNNILLEYNDSIKSKFLVVAETNFEEFKQIYEFKNVFINKFDTYEFNFNEKDYLVFTNYYRDTTIDINIFDINAQTNKNVKFTNDPNFDIINTKVFYCFDQDTLFVAIKDSIFYLDNKVQTDSLKFYIKLPNNGQFTHSMYKFDNQFMGGYFDDKRKQNYYYLDLSYKNETGVVDNFQIENDTYLYTMPPYPNPTMSEVTAKFYWDRSIDIDNSEIAVYDINGNKVSGKENLTLEKLNEWSGNIKWNCVGQPKGTYLIKIQHGNNTKTVKVVVN